jgi:hypothetical protein
MIDHTASMILVLVYSFLVAVGTYAVILYHNAYYKMHKTKMIKSVYFLLISLLIENIYFGIAAFFTDISSSIADVFMMPALWAVPKLLLLFATIYFIYTSLAPSDFKTDSECGICGEKK